MPFSGHPQGFTLLALVVILAAWNIRDGKKNLVTWGIQNQNDNDGSHEALRKSNYNATTAILQNHTQHKNNKNNKVFFLNRASIPEINDFFSASWLAPTSKFVHHYDINRIATVESACFAFFNTNRRDIRMTLDWLDFSVEHMSKWWKIMDVFGEDPAPFEKAISSFHNYVQKATIQEDSPLRPTLAVIAFQPYTSPNKEDRGKELTASALAATLASLLQVGFGRVVVVGHRMHDEDQVQRAFRHVRDNMEGPNITNNNDEPVLKIGSTEVGYANVTTEEVKSKFVPINIPRGALYVLQKAFKGELDEEREKAWLGRTHNASYWKYVYLTEPDTILLSKPWVLPQLKDALDEGLILAPHRFQPLAHESDVPTIQNKLKVVPSTGNFSTVLELNSIDGGACCDENAGSYKPWRDFPKQCQFWWQCGFNQQDRKHELLTPYSFIRLQHGTGVVNLAASPHGRRCIPKQNSVCVPPGASLKDSHDRHY